MTPRNAMLLAAGLGTRMRPLTSATAKPLLPLGGRTLLDHALDRLRDAGVEKVVVNVHWKSERMVEHLRARKGPPAISVLHEMSLLETGGAVRAALDQLGPDPFFVVNGDTVWLDGPSPALSRIADAWGDDVDVVLLLHRTFQVHTEVGRGDFALDPLGLARRPEELEIVPYVYAGLQLMRPSVFDGSPEGPFSLNLLWDKALAEGRLRAVVHDGLWYHLTTPEDLAEAEFSLQARAVGETR